jgi:hypothetical protein
MKPMNGLRVLGAACLGASLLLGCGSDSSSSSNGAGFVGVWNALSTNGTDSCGGDFQSEPGMPVGFTMKLRVAAGGLEYVSLAAYDLTEETCVQKFTVSGNSAEIVADQDCSYPNVDPQTGESLGPD